MCIFPMFSAQLMKNQELLVLNRLIECPVTFVKEKLPIWMHLPLIFFDCSKVLFNLSSAKDPPTTVHLIINETYSRKCLS